MTASATLPDTFLNDLVEATRSRRSWRERLQWLRDRFADPAFAPTPAQLAIVAVYLRLLATGAIPCAEDGRHFRPNHHAEAALHIEAALERLTVPETAWVLRRIYPYLPSWGDEFRRAEPLTRIRDIAHRNDIPADLKREIKTRLQNKLHRCAGPEDLRTAEEILGRISAGGGYSPAFVQEFRVFHGELQEFFNATSLDSRLRSLAAGDSTLAGAARSVLELKEQTKLADERRLDLLDRVTALRSALGTAAAQAAPRQRSQFRLADVGLEDYAFRVLSEIVNGLEDLQCPGAWAALLRALSAALDQLRLSQIAPAECAALRDELTAWARGFDPAARFQLLRLTASLARARRLAEDYADETQRLFQPPAQLLGQALGIAEHAIRVFTEGDVRGHVVFQLSKLVDLGLRACRAALRLPPWEAIVPGECHGRLVRAASLAAIESEPGPLVVLLDEVDGDAELPPSICGVLLGHPLPHLSHLGVRARQARVPFAACVSREYLGDHESLVGKPVCLRVAADGVRVIEAAAPTMPDATEAPRAVAVPEASLTPTGVLPLDQATAATCGAKAAGAGRLSELAGQSQGKFRAPRGLAIPFGTMQQALDAAPVLRQEYQALQEQLARAPQEEIDATLDLLRALVQRLPVPTAMVEAVAAFFGPDARLAVRSSANGEDLEDLAGAGLYESIVNVAPPEVAGAIARVWASLWTRRATLSRARAGIPHAAVRMAVLVQELIVPELSFILHTVHPLTGNREEAVIELAVGLGEVLASAAVPGTPYRLTCNRRTGAAALDACASFALALRPSPAGTANPSFFERLDYSRVPLSVDPEAAPLLGRRLAEIAVRLEESLGGAQDVEGVCAAGEIHIVQARPQQGL